MNLATAIKETAINVDALLVSTRMDYRVRELLVSAITGLRCAAEIQAKIESHEIALEYDDPHRPRFRD